MQERPKSFDRNATGALSSGGCY